MDTKKKKIVAASATVFALIVLLLILWWTIGLSAIFFVIASLILVTILSILVWISLTSTRSPSMVTRATAEGIQLRLEYSFLRKVAGLPAKFSLKTLEAATENFQALLGRGSSGSVFKGVLDDGTHVAVKRIESPEHGEKEFKAEISVIASVHHVNLVRLIGYCLVASGPRFLVYEFVSNGSLNNWIFPGHRRPCLSWSKRFQVGVDVAKALAYLHHDCRSRVLHLDVKPENILLDENFRALVSDFGLSKLMSKDESRIVTTMRGTRGYLAPEWLLDRGVTEKSDIFSYGMVLLEIVGGRRNVHLIEDVDDRARQRWSYFPKVVAEKVRTGMMMEVVDERLVVMGGVDERQVRTMVYVALWCVQEEAKLRPSMARVLDMLEGRVAVGMPPETEMMIVDMLGLNLLLPRVPQESQQPAISACSFAMSNVSGR